MTVMTSPLPVTLPIGLWHPIVHLDAFVDSARYKYAFLVGFMIALDYYACRMLFTSAAAALVVAAVSGVNASPSGIFPDDTVASYGFDGDFRNSAGSVQEEGLAARIRFEAAGLRGGCGLFDGTSSLGTELDISPGALADATLFAWVRPDRPRLDTGAASRYM